MDGSGAMGFAVEIPADGADGFALCCDECGRVERFKARFMGCRVRELGRAKREGWGWRRDGRLVEETLPEGSVRRRVARLCPACATIERHAAEGGTWGRLLAELRGFRAELAEPAVHEIAPAVHEPAQPVHLHPSGQLDLFGHAA